MGTVLVTILVVLFVAVAVGALIIMLATRVAAGFTPGFGAAFLAALVAAIAAGVLSWVIHTAMGITPATHVISLVLVFLLNSAIINAIVKRPGGASLGFGTACLVSLMQIVIEIVIGVVLMFVFGAAMFSAFSTMH